MLDRLWRAGQNAISVAAEAAGTTRTTVVGGLQSASESMRDAAVTAGEYASGFVTEAFSPTSPRERSHAARVSEKEAEKDQPNRARRVFVIHGREMGAWHAMQEFLGAVGLQPYNFVQTLDEDEGAAPYIGDIVRRGLRSAQAIIAVFTPDERSSLHPGLVEAVPSQRQYDVGRWQARPNVIFEAGMAMALSPKRTVLVALGPDVEFLSDAAGRYVHRAQADSAEFRERLLERLATAGCPVRRDRKKAYLKAGDFQGVIDRITERTRASSL